MLWRSPQLRCVAFTALAFFYAKLQSIAFDEPVFDASKVEDRTKPLTNGMHKVSRDAVNMKIEPHSRYNPDHLPDSFDGPLSESWRLDEKLQRTGAGGSARSKWDSTTNNGGKAYGNNSRDRKSGITVKGEKEREKECVC